MKRGRLGSSITALAAVALMLVAMPAPPAQAVICTDNPGPSNSCPSGDSIETKQTCGTDSVTAGPALCEAGSSALCGDKSLEWHFVLNGVASQANCPATLTLTWSDDGTQQVAFEKFTGGTCHYTLCQGDAAGSILASAVASCDGGFTYNQFNVSHAPCAAAFTFNSCSQVVSADNVDQDSNPKVIVDECTERGVNTVIEANITRPDDLRDVFVINYANATARPTGTVQFQLFRDEACLAGEVTTGGPDNSLTVFPAILNIATDCVYDDNGVAPFTGSAICQSPTHLFGVVTGAGPWGFLATWTPDQAATDAGYTPAPAPVCEHWPSPAVSTQIIRNSDGADITGTFINVTSLPVTIHDTATVDNFSLPIPVGSTVVFQRYTGLTCEAGKEDGAAEEVAIGDGVKTSDTVSSSSYQVTIANFPAGLSYLATFFFAGAEEGVPAAACEPLGVCANNLTPGYWKNHLALTGTTGCSGLPQGSGCSNNGPFTLTYLPKTLGGFNVDTILKAAQVFAAMNCSNSGTNSQQNQNAIGCLAGHLLAAKLNVANGAPTIAAIAAADALLSSIPYTGPSGNYTGISATTRAQAIALKSLLDAFNNLLCPTPR
jgi:hypothetical protein